MKRTFTRNQFALSALAAALLSACGGGSDSNFLSDDSQYNNFGGGANGKPLDALNQAPSTTKKFLVDMNDEGQQTKRIVASVDDNGSGVIDLGDAVRFNQPGVISEICTNCAGADDLTAAYQKQVDDATSARDAAQAVVTQATTDLAADPNNTALQAALAAAQQALATAAADLAEAQRLQSTYAPVADVVYMRDLNNRLHTAYYRNVIDHNDNTYSKFLSHDVGVRKIDAERKIENGQANMYNHGGSIGRGYNGVILFGTPQNETSTYVDAYLRDPAAMGMSYNTFAVFSSGFMRNTRDVNVGYQSIGKHATEFPTQGTATYTGIGHAYINDAAAASYSGDPDSQVSMDVKVDADFAKRSLSFNTSNAYIHTFETAYGHVVQARPDLHLSGSAGWNRGASDFTGTVRNAGGNLSGSLEGSFFGPAAAEVGGVFGLTGADAADGSTTHYVGGFSAKRP